MKAMVFQKNSTFFHGIAHVLWWKSVHRICVLEPLYAAKHSSGMNVSIVFLMRSDYVLRFTYHPCLDAFMGIDTTLTHAHPWQCAHLYCAKHHLRKERTVLTALKLAVACYRIKFTHADTILDTCWYPIICNKADDVQHALV